MSRFFIDTLFSIRDIHLLTRGGLSAEDFQSMVVNTLQEREDMISAMRTDLPESDNKDSIVQEYEGVIRSRLLRRLELVRGICWSLLLGAFLFILWGRLHLFLLVRADGENR